MCATYVDDTLQAGDSQFVKLSEETLRNFQCRDREWSNVQFAGVEIDTRTSEFVIHQKRYISKLNPLTKEGSF
jgi:hypothetical protein